MSARLYLVVAVCGIIQGCATLTNNLNEIPGDLSETLPPPAAGKPIEPKVFKSEQEATKGPTYGVEQQPRSSVQHIVDGKVAKTWQVADAIGDADSAANKTASSKSNTSEYLSGQDAIDTFSAEQFKALADSLNVTEEFLKDQMLNDDDLKVDKEGRLLYMDKGPSKDELAELAKVGTMPVMDAPAGTDLYKLHSKSGASKVLYLDFTGPAIPAGTAWLGGMPIQAVPFTQNIYAIWKGVMDDYAPFDVDVTTEKPSAEAMERTDFYDKNYGFTVVISGSRDMGICNGMCGGVSYVNVFASVNNKRVQPSWVFSEMYPVDNRERYISTVIAHESGHSLGLMHKGIGPHAGFQMTDAYYDGRYHETSVIHGALRTHTPIMGKGYYSVIPQWSDGNYSMWSNNKQDDMAYIAESIPRIPADTTNTKETASSFQTAYVSNVNGVRTNIVKTVGLIEVAEDLDYYTFDVQNAASDIDFLISNCVDKEATEVINMDMGNLHIFATLYDEAGNVVKEFKEKSPSVRIKMTLEPGKYYIAITSGSYARQISPNTYDDYSFFANSDHEGYTNYGSLGYYSITGYYSSGLTPTTPTATIDVSKTTGKSPLTVNFNSARTNAGNSTITSYDWDFGNGQTSTMANPTTVFENDGTYNVFLTVTNKAGLSNTISKQIVVTTPVAPPPVVYTGETVSIKAITINTAKAAGSTTKVTASIALQNKSGNPEITTKVTGTFSGNLTTGTGKKLKAVAIVNTTFTAKLNKKAQTLDIAYPKALPNGVKGTLTFNISSIAPTSTSIKYQPEKNITTSALKTF
jgi:PKD repeat protein